MPEYSHTLIPSVAEFVPTPQQVVSFLKELDAIEAMPLMATFSLIKPDGASKSFVNPITGQVQSFARRTATSLKSVAGLSKALTGLTDYDVASEGKGPPKTPAFRFDFKGAYDFAIRCCLRPEVVSTSDWHDEVPLKRKVPFFGEPCSPRNHTGIFLHPRTLAVIKVPKAGCARFWIEFEFGKMLIPAIEDSLELIEPQIVNAASKCFGVDFVQGCHWCA